MTEPAPLLCVRELGVAYGRVAAVTGISLKVASGSIVTVIGANGAGKSTTLNALIGLLPATGSVLFEGRHVDHLPAEERVAAGMSLVPERRALFMKMTVEDNLRLGTHMLGLGRADIGRALHEIYAMFPRLEERRAQFAGTLSGGERQMLALGRALIGRPSLLMLDEPSLGLAPLIVRDMFITIAGLRKAGLAILLVEQNARAALKIADHAYVMDTGRIVLEGTASELATDPRVIATYLGAAVSRDSE